MNNFFPILVCLTFVIPHLLLTEAVAANRMICGSDSSREVASRSIAFDSDQRLAELGRDATDSLSLRLNDSLESTRFQIIYRVNRSDLDLRYKTNRTHLDYLRYQLINSPRVDSVIIFSYASPEGPYRLNKRLSEDRAETARQFIMSCMTEDNALSKAKIIFRPTPENWDGLRHSVVDRYPYADKDRILEIIDSDMPSDLKKRKIFRMGQRPWRYVIDSLMPSLRFAEWVCYYQPVPMKSIVMEEEHPLLSRTTLPEKGFIPPKPQLYKKTVFALKTNLLYDAVSWLNFGIEIPFAGDRFSIVYDHQFPWWRGGEGNNKFCMRYLQMGGELRWWFHPRMKPSTRHNIVRDRLSGHFLGAYGMAGKWDFENGRKICYQGEFWSAGLTYGYAMPIGRRLNLEFSVAVGYASIPYRHFIPSEDYDMLFRDPTDAGTWGYFGVTKLGVSLVVPITVQRPIRSAKGGRR